MPIATKIDYITDSLLMIVMITPNVINEIIHCEIFSSDIELMNRWMTKLSDSAKIT